MDINTTPLIDVMLVLLVMLIITIPIQLHAVNMDLPVGKPPEKIEQQLDVTINLDAQNKRYWQGLEVSDAELVRKLQALSSLATQPIIKIHPNKAARYAVFAKLLADTKRLRLTKVAVIGAEQFAQYSPSMSYHYRPQSSNRRLQAIGIAALVHLLLIWLLFTNTGRATLKNLKKPLEAVVIQEVTIPPPPPLPPKKVQAAEPKKPAIPAPSPVFIPKSEVPPPPSSAAPVPARPTPSAPTPIITPAPTAAPAPPATAAPAPVVKRQDIGVVCPTMVKPLTPRRAIEEGINATVKAEITILDGKPIKVIVTGNKLFESAVHNAVMRYKCNSSGEVTVTQIFKFTLEEDE